MYIGGRGESGKGHREIKVPDQYHGSAFPDALRGNASSEQTSDHGETWDRTGRNDRTDRTDRTGRNDRNDRKDRTEDVEALRRAEEAFRRGYVFEETAPPIPPVDGVAVGDIHIPEENEPAGTGAVAVPASASVSEPAPATASARAAAPTVGRSLFSSIGSGGGILSGILGSITLEHIVLIALMLILFDSKADDELLLMLAILFIC